jgi:hypothetical protein
LSAPRCGCGYLFEVEQAGDDTHAVELEAQQERIYLDYLAARAAQAEEAYRVAKRLLEADPESVVKSADVLVAQQQLHAAQAELTSQTIKTRAALARAQALRKSKPTLAVVKNPEPVRAERRGSKPPKVAKGASPARRVATPASAESNPSETLRRQSAAMAPPSVSPAAAKPAVGDQLVASAAVSQARPLHDTPKPPAAVKPGQPIGRAVTTALRATHPLTDAPSSRGAARTAAAVETASPAQAAANNAPRTGNSETPPPRAVGKPVPAPPPSMTAPGAARPSPQPTPAFREAQSAKAKDIVARRQGTSPAGAPRAKPPAPRKPAPQPAAARAAEESKECPSCTATVALTVMKCRCGFAFSHGLELPGVVLTPAERATLLQGFELVGPRKPT